MSSKLTDRQQQVLDCIRECLSDSGMAPTRAEIADIMGFQSKNAASDHLRALERKGYIKLHSDRSRGIQLLDKKNCPSSAGSPQAFPSKPSKTWNAPCRSPRGCSSNALPTC